jgi:opacity protein-like surface antigen
MCWWVLRLLSLGLVRLRSLSAIAVCLCLTAASAEAQRRPVVLHASVPEAGDLAAGASVGLSTPTDRFFGNGIEVAGGIEGYLTPRVAVRGQLGTTWWDITGLRGADEMQPMFVSANLVYNWGGEVWHPYVTGGIGVYRFKFEGERGDDSDSSGGFNFGGGIEYFMESRTAITGEVLYHSVGDFRTSGLTFAEGSFWSFMGGLKTYFGR